MDREQFSRVKPTNWRSIAKATSVTYNTSEDLASSILVFSYRKTCFLTRGLFILHYILQRLYYRVFIIEYLLKSLY